jgi:hypothetical protein
MAATNRSLRCALFALLLAGCGGGEFTDAAQASGSGGAAQGGSGGAAQGGSGGAAQGGSGGAAQGGSGGAPSGDGGQATGGQAGSGGSPTTDAAADAPSCPDTDGDGQTTCAGDCDDNDPNNFVGNKEICGDLKDNNCDGAADEGCQGLGTFVSGAVGIDVNPGTKDKPLKTILQGITNAVRLGGGLAVYVAAGHYPEQVTLVEGVDVLGGFACSALPCTWARDRIVNDTAILVPTTALAGVVAPVSVTSKTRLDGFRVMGASGTPAGYPGSCALTLQGSTPTITNNRIFGGTVTTGTPGSVRSQGVCVSGPSNTPQGAIFTDNTITGGAATDVSAGVLVDTKAVVVLRQNTVKAGAARTSDAIMMWSSGPGTLIENNDVFAGDSTGGTSWGIVVAALATIDKNRVNVDPAQTGKCTSPTDWCGGIASYSATSTIANNVVFGVPSTKSAGFLLAEMEVAAGVVVLNGNYLDGGGSPNPGTSVPSVSAAVALKIGLCNTCGLNGLFGRVRNNVLAGGNGSARFGLYEDSVAGKTEHPEALQNNDFFLRVMTPMDGLYRAWDGSTGTNLTAIAQVNALTTTPGVAANFAADPLVDAKFHLSVNPRSPCIDAATKVEAPPLDMDGDQRPKGVAFDVGPDEAN